MEAAYFDGYTSRRHRVILTAEPGILHCRDQEGTYSVHLADLRVSEPQGGAPRTLRCAGGGFYEVAQGAELTALLDELGYRETRVVKLQSRWRWVAASFAGVLLTVWVGYQWGLPLFAKEVAPSIPIALLQRISGQIMTLLDEKWLHPSQLPEARQQALTQAFTALAAGDPKLKVYGWKLRLHFRSSGGFGPNAFALPGGEIVLLDELAEKMTDAEIISVLAHEQGHVSHRHTVRQLIQSSVVAFVMAAYLGDISSVAAAGAGLLFERGYSRDMEREADDYALNALRRQGLPPRLMVEALQKLEPDKTCQKDSSSPKRKDWLNTHPDTCQRIQRLEKEVAQ